MIGELRLDLAEVDTTSSVEVWADIEKIKKVSIRLEYFNFPWFFHWIRLRHVNAKSKLKFAKGRKLTLRK